MRSRRVSWDDLHPDGVHLGLPERCGERGGAPRRGPPAARREAGVLSVVSRWRWQAEERIQRVRLASGDGGAAVLDNKGRITLLDTAGTAIWTRTVEDSVRDIGIAAAGREDHRPHQNV
jgi:hypothetical protein